MKIVFLIEFANNTGGMLQSVTSIINGLAATGEHTITLVSPNDSEISKTNFMGKVNIICTKSKTWSISRKHLLSTLATSFELWRLTRKMIKDSYFITNDYGSSILLSLFPAFKLKEIYICRGGDFKSSGLGAWFMRTKIQKRRIEQIITTSSHLKRMIASMGYPDNKITVIFNGVSKPKSMVREAKALPSQGIRIGTIGYISDRKNQIEGARMIKLLLDKNIDAYLLIYGIAGSADDVVYQTKLEKEIKALGIEKNVIFKGFVKGDALFEGTDIMISFAKEEGFGRTLPEAMLRNVPFIAYRGAGGPVDITNDGEYGYLVDNCIAKDFYDQLLWMRENPEKVVVNIKQSYEYAMNVFTEKQMVDRYKKFLQIIS